MIYRSVEQIIESAILTTKERLKYIAEKNKKTNKYNEKIKKRVKKQERGQNVHKCDFCGKDQTKVKRIIAGKSADICDECVLICMEILLKEINNFKAIEFREEK